MRKDALKIYIIQILKQMGYFHCVQYQTCGYDEVEKEFVLTFGGETYWKTKNVMR